MFSPQTHTKGDLCKMTEMLTNPTVVIISYTYIKSSHCIPSTYTMLYVNISGREKRSKQVQILEMKSTVIKMNNTFYSFMNNLIKPRKDSAKIKTSQ